MQEAKSLVLWKKKSSHLFVVAKHLSALTLHPLLLALSFPLDGASQLFTNAENIHCKRRTQANKCGELRHLFGYACCLVGCLSLTRFLKCSLNTFIIVQDRFYRAGLYCPSSWALKGIKISVPTQFSLLARDSLAILSYIRTGDCLMKTANSSARLRTPPRSLLSLPPAFKTKSRPWSAQRIL